MRREQEFKEDDWDGATPPRLLKVAEVAHLLHVHPNTVRLWSRIGVLKAYRIGKRRDYRFSPADSQTFLHRDENGEE
jgi:excisionase family DNA binding protein